MKRKTYSILIISYLLWTFLPEVGKAQQIGTFLKFQEYTEHINHASSLMSDDVNIYSIGRKQWLGVEGSPSTALLGGHLKTKNGRNSFGLTAVYDKVGPETYNEVNAFYGFNVRLTENDYIGTGVGLGLRFYNVRYGALNSADPNLGEDIQEKIGGLNLSLVYYRPEQLYIGVSLPRLGDGSYSEFAAFRPTYSFIGGYLHTVDEGMHIKANTWVTYRNDDIANNTVANVSALAYFNRKIGVGLSYATTKDMGLLASFLLNEKFKFGYAYQMAVSSNNMGKYHNGTHEFSLSYHFSREGRIKLL